MKILIIDDSKAIHAVLSEMLSSIKGNLTHCYNGKEGMEAALQPNIQADLIFMDWEMPVMSGIDALSHIRGAGVMVPIVMMTTKNAMSDISEALEKGATDYIIKPFTKDIIVGKIFQVIGKVVE